MIERIQWLNYGSFLIQGPPLIYINPWRITRNTFLADVILIGHDHEQHCSPADISKLRGPNTRIIGNSRVSRQIEGCENLRPWQSIHVDRAGIKAIPAYSLESWQHRPEDGGLGFLISLNYYDVYYAGDTEIIPEMDQLHPDIAILPIDGNGTMTIETAAELVKRMRPRIVVPANWNPGDQAIIRDFRRLVGNRAEVIIPFVGAVTR